jgi:hypothetical protein
MNIREIKGQTDLPHASLLQHPYNCGSEYIRKSCYTEREGNNTDYFYIHLYKSLPRLFQTERLNKQNRGENRILPNLLNQT